MTLHFLLLACAAATAAAGNVHLHDDGMDLYWKLEENDTVVVINMTCPSTTQYCSVGLGESMSEADTVLCSVVEANGTVVCYDGSVTGHRVPAQDVQGDVAVESFNVDGSWSVVFKRAVDTEDVAGDQKFNLNGLPQSIIWAVGDLDSTGSFSKHGRSDRGIEKVVWRPMAFEAEPREFESGVGMAVAWEVRVDASVMLVNVTCPRAEVYCAVGLEGEGFTDVLLCYLEDGAALCVDGVANATGVPAPDGTSDVTVIAHAVAEDGSWSVLYRRFVSTADDEDVGFFVNGAEQRVTWAIGTVTADAGGVVFQNMSTAETGELDVVWRPFAFDRQLRHAFHETMELEWELIEDRTVIAINMTCGSEYCAIGLGEDMSDADTMTCWKPLGAESVTCSDGHVTRHRAPAADAQQDLTIISSVTNGNGTWSVVFTRRVASADPADKQFTIDATPQAIIWANGSVSDGSLSRHGSSDRGFAAIAWSRVHLDDPQHEALGEGIDLRWELKEGRSFVAVNLTCPSLDNWCGLGIGEEAAGVDTVLCWMTASMEAVCEDGHIAAGLQISVADGQQDVAVILHELQPDGSWSVLFTKPVHTGDGNDTTVTVNGQSQSIVWATGANDAAKEYLFADGSSTVYWHLIAFEHPSRHELSADGMVLTWELMEEKQLIAVDMSCPSTSSYCAMGLGDDMYGADTVLCWFNESTEEAFCKDGFVNGHTEPTPDASQDVVVISWASADGGWSVFFTRKTTTADSLKDAAFETRPGVAQPIIWAFGGIGEDGKVSRHARSTRGMSAVAWDPMQLVDELSQELFDGMTISWVLHDGSGEDSWIAVNMTCPSAEKYCAIGLGVDMYGSDVITCWVADEFVGVECQDGWVNDHESPTADDQQDCTVLHSEINADGSWSVLFTRAVATGDASDVALTVNGQAQSVIFASGGYNNGTYSKHRRSTRGVTSVTWRPLLLLNPHHIELAQGMDLYWQLRDQSTSIIVNLSCPSAQYFCAIGLGHDMDDADTMLCWVNGTEVACIDGAVTGHRAPLADEQQDLVVITSTVESDDSWSVVFTRAVNTSDPSDKQFVTNGQQQGMIWAYGNHTDGTPSKHRRDTRGGLALAWKPISLADPQHLDLAAGMDLQWELFDDYSLIAINMTCPSTDSYCAIGLGKDMSDADTVICWVADDAVKCSDGTVSRHRAPAADAQQDYVVLAYEVAVDDSWSVFLARAVDTGDAADKPFVVDSGKQPVIWAHGPNVNGSFSRHERDTRGAVDVAWRRLFLSDPHHVGLAGGMGLSWQLFEEDSFIAIEMTCPSTEQYCAIGLGEDMDDADTILCWLDDNTANCSDGFVTGHDKPTADAQQDVSIVTSQVSADGTWSVLFTRAVNSSDAGDKAFVVDGRTQPFIWAFGSYGAGSFGRHKRSTRGASGIAWKPLTLVDPQHVELATGMDLYWQIIEGGTVIAFNMTCPAADTEKYCSFGLGESMDDADTVLCWADDTAVSCKDGSVSGHHEPVTDDQQDFIVVSSAMQSDGSWSVLFTREVRSSDTTDKAFLVDGQKQPIIWAHGTYNNATFSRHKRSTRGQTAIAWKRLSLTNPQHMQAATGMTLYWELLEENTIVAINMSCPSDELYCAIGLGEDMDDADTTLCWVQDSQVFCSDGSVSGHDEPEADSEQNVIVVAFEVLADGSWSVLFARAVRSSDPTDKTFTVTGLTQSVIYAVGSYSGGIFARHSRGTSARGVLDIAWKSLALDDAQQIELADGMDLFWQLMDGDSLMVINMTCPSTEGYCAIGLGEDMDDADTVLCWVDGPVASCSDGFVTGHAAPAADDQQDYTVISSEITPNGTWSVLLTRPVVSSDAADKAFVVVDGQKQPIIWAYGAYSNGTYSKHKRSTRGQAAVAWKPLSLSNPHRVELATGMDLYWELLDDDATVAIKLTCPSTEQYCAIGLGEDMDDADTLLCWVGATGVICSDGSVSGHEEPVADDQQDYVLIKSEISEDSWSVLLTRAVQSGDATDMAFIVDGQQQPIIWAYGTYNADDASFSKHKRSTRGATSIAWKYMALTDPVHLEVATDMHLSWQLMDDDALIAINMTCPSVEQYCAIGLGEDMDDADTIHCWMGDVAAVCSDGSVSGHAAPAVDDQQDHVVIASEVSPNGTWSVFFTRSVNSSDATDKAFVVNGQLQPAIWAYGTYNATADKPFIKHKRSTRGKIGIAWKPLILDNPRHIELAADVHLYWQVMEDETLIAINMTCPSTEQYCAFGLGQSMDDADTVLCRVDGGAAVCFDGSVSGHAAPVADDQQDYTFITSEVSANGAWSVLLTRPVHSSDPTDKAFVVDGQEQAVIWAFGKYSDGVQQHARSTRGAVNIAWGLLRLTNPSHVALAEGMDLYWEVMAEQSVIAINLTCPTSEQYCSFGLGQDMADADTVLCWVANAAVQCTDGSVVGHDAPAADQQQDYDVLAFDIAATGAWSVLLKRLVVSSDPGDKPFIIDGEQQQMIWAFGDMDSNGIPQEHSRRSKGSLAVAWGGEKQETGATKTFAEGMVLRWSVSDAEDVVTFNLTCPSTEMYCSFGLGEEMVNSDVFMCFARDGAATCTDSHVRDELVAPLADASQDLTVLEHAVVGAAWWVVFSRPVATADGADDRVLDVAEGAEPQAVIWAQGQHADGEFIEHEGGGRGMTRLAWADKSAVDTVVPATPIPPPTTPVPGASLHRLTDDFSASVELRRRDLSGKQRSSVALADANFPYTHVLLTFVCRVGQYCALGLSDDGTMLQSDAFVCWEHADGIRCVDWYCTSRATCPEDASQDLVVEETQVLGDGWFTVKVSRLLDTGDDKDRAIASENIDFIFANGPASAVSTPTTKHAAEGTAAINALTGTAEVTSDDDTVWIHILISLFLLTVLGLVSGIMIMVKPRFGYFFQQSAVGSVLSMVFIMCSLVTMSIGDYEHYRGRIVEYGVLFGGPAQICLALTLLVKVKMFSPCLFLMSVPQERALVWHRWIGRMGWLFVTLHGSLVIAEYRENNDGDASVLLHTELGTGGTTDGAGKVRPLYGIIAWVLYTVLVLLGLPAIRRIFYQAFVASHVVLSLCTLVFTILHLPDGWRTYAIFGLPVLLYVLDCLYRVYLSVHNSYILQHTNVGSVTKLTIVPPKPIKKWGPGSYFCVSIPQAGYMEYHPLSVTSHHSTKTATFYVKNMGPGTWTERLTQLPSEPKIELQAKLEGPYGKLSFDIDKHNNLILIAGGIGVTPMLSVIRYMDVAQEATLSWSVRDAELVQMLMDDLHELAARFKGLKVIVSFTGAGLDDVKFETERIAIVRGRPDYTALLVKNATEHSAVAICGPSGMIVGASDAVRRSPLRLPLHTETFEL